MRIQAKAWAIVKIIIVATNCTYMYLSTDAGALLGFIPEPLGKIIDGLATAIVVVVISSDIWFATKVRG